MDDQWCKSLGGSNYVKHSEGKAGYPKYSCVFGCNSYDEVNWHWCDCGDGYWYNQSLDSTQSNFDAVISITCARNMVSKFEITHIPQMIYPLNYF